MNLREIIKELDAYIYKMGELENELKWKDSLIKKLEDEFKSNEFNPVEMVARLKRLEDEYKCSHCGKWLSAKGHYRQDALNSEGYYECND